MIERASNTSLGGSAGAVDESLGSKFAVFRQSASLIFGFGDTGKEGGLGGGFSFCGDLAVTWTRQSKDRVRFTEADKVGEVLGDRATGAGEDFDLLVEQTLSSLVAEEVLLDFVGRGDVLDLRGGNCEGVSCVGREGVVPLIQ